LTLGYALDDYITRVTLSGELQEQFLSQGRFTFALLNTALEFSRLRQSDLAGVGFFLCAGGLLCVYWFTLEHWLQKKICLSIALGAMLGAHPFFTEYVSFRQALFPMGVCFVLLAGASRISTKLLCLRIYKGYIESLRSFNSVSKKICIYQSKVTPLALSINYFWLVIF
jgi:hypothetical protein